MKKRNRSGSTRTPKKGLPQKKANKTVLVNVPAAGLAPPAPNPVRDELFDICCFYMGQGDCTLIRCPDGRLVMIDCGTKAYLTVDFLEIILNQVRHVDWAGPTMRIDALILTHSDRDHYSYVGVVLGEYTTMTNRYLKLKIDKIYLSNASIERDEDHNITKISPLGKYTTNGLNNVVYRNDFNTTEIQEVTICSNNDNNNFYRRWAKDDYFKTRMPYLPAGNDQWPIANRKHTVLNGTTATGKQWSVSLIAGNVPKVTTAITDIENGVTYRDGATPDNARSLITLLEIGQKKLLFCGDATFSTERFLLQHQLARISDVEFVLAPHHGSEWASSPPFVNAVNPMHAVISVAYMEHTHRHPREAAVSLWRDQVSQGTPRHIDYWVEDQDGAVDTWQDWTTNRAHEIDIEKSGTFANLTAPFMPHIPSPGSDFYAIYQGWGFLYREDTQSNLEETPFGIQPQNPLLPQFLHYQIG